MRGRRRMTGPEFEAVRPLLNISEDRIVAARAALVDGKTFEAAAAPYGWTRQAVNAAVGVVWKTRERLLESQQARSVREPSPPGWEAVTLVAPRALIDEFRKRIAEATPDVARKTSKKDASEGSSRALPSKRSSRKGPGSNRTA